MIKDYVCVDLETTGLDAKQNKILEIGAVKVRDFEVVDSFSRLVNPGAVIDERIMELTGITNEMVENEAYIEEILPEFLDFCGNDVLLGHNMPFDYSFLKRNAVNNNLPFDYLALDTLKIARKHLAHLESRRLEYLCNYYGIVDSNHHRAYNDAMVAHELYKLLCREEFFDENDSVFTPSEIIYKVKKEQPITQRQINYLNDLIKYHKIEFDADINRLTRNEASRQIDKILFNYGKPHSNH